MKWNIKVKIHVNIWLGTRNVQQFWREKQIWCIYSAIADIKIIDLDKEVQQEKLVQISIFFLWIICYGNNFRPHVKYLSWLEQVFFVCVNYPYPKLLWKCKGKKIILQLCLLLLVLVYVLVADIIYYTCENVLLMYWYNVVKLGF